MTEEEFLKRLTALCLEAEVHIGDVNSYDHDPSFDAPKWCVTMDEVQEAIDLNEPTVGGGEYGAGHALCTKCRGFFWPGYIEPRE